MSRRLNEYQVDSSWSIVEKIKIERLCVANVRERFVRPGLSADTGGIEPNSALCWIGPSARRSMSPTGLSCLKFQIYCSMSVFASRSDVMWTFQTFPDTPSSIEVRRHENCS